MRRHTADGLVEVVLSLDVGSRAEAAREMAFRVAVGTSDAVGRLGRTIGLGCAFRRR